MRILGVTEKWPKLKNPSWTTFRLQRRDKDWQVREVVQVVLHPRSKQREVLGEAVIVGKERRHFASTITSGEVITSEEAWADGFDSEVAMFRWFLKAHGSRVRSEPLNKLTVEWIGEHHV